MLLEGSENSITFEKNLKLKEAFLQAYSLDACTFVTPEGKIFPFDTYNLFYRDQTPREIKVVERSQ